MRLNARLLHVLGIPKSTHVTERSKPKQSVSKAFTQNELKVCCQASTYPSNQNIIYVYISHIKNGAYEGMIILERGGEVSVYVTRIQILVGEWAESR